MVHNYYCVDCGNKLRAEQISFDLADLLGIKIENIDSSTGKRKRSTVEILQSNEYEEHKFVKSKTTQISVKKLRELAEKRGIQLSHRKKTFMRVTLMEFLRIMGENVGRDTDRGEILGEVMAQYHKSELAEALEEVYGTNENTEVAQRMIRQWQAALENRFQLSLEAEKFIMNNSGDESKREIIDKLQDNTANYEAGFWLEPEFFEDGKSQSIYTIRYSHDMKAAFMEDIHEPLTIRGYCPICGQPVIDGAGKYPHELVGMLGVQSAGKTSLILALISQLQETFDEFGINYPGAALCDSRYDIMQNNHKLYDCGWAVVKTNASSNEGTFNVSFRISNKDNTVTKLLTLVDIAGEQCYDLKYGVVNQNAFKTYPLIGQCTMYLLCSCIDQTGYGNADGETSFIPLQALIQIAEQIYAHIPDKTKIPPLCLVMTKTDMASNSGGAVEGENPFDNVRGTNSYEFASQLENMKLIYSTTDNENIRGPLSWCKNTFDNMKTKTYVSILTCSALGRAGVRYDGNIADIRPYTENGKTVPFKRTRIGDVWRWILQVAGLSPVPGTSRNLPYVVSYNEHYLLPNNNNGKGYKATQESMHFRCLAVQKLFINQSDTDRQIIVELRRERGWFDPRLDRALETLVVNKGIVAE